MCVFRAARHPHARNGGGVGWRCARVCAGGVGWAQVVLSGFTVSTAPFFRFCMPVFMLWKEVFSAAPACCRAGQAAVPR